MQRHFLMMISLALATAGPLEAATFARSPIAPELELDSFTRRVARDRVGRDLFATPYATVTIANVDVYDRFPYVESRRFQVVSDPRWNRLVFGESARSLRAYDGKGTALGALSDPRGMAVDEWNRVYVADAGNNRLVVLQASTELGEIQLVPLHAIGGLNAPYDVAYSDGGTPFVAGDDFLYVADTGRNRVVAMAIQSSGARTISALGDLGSGPGRFAGPMAITAGRADGANTREVYVADAHNRRIVHLRHESGGLRWIEDARHDADILTSLDTDQWGNLYAAAPNQGVVHKFSPALAAVAELRDDVSRPRDFHVPISQVRDHRDGSVSRVGQPNGVAIEQWSDDSGMKMWRLGVEVSGLSVAGNDGPVAHFTLTDRAAVTLEVVDASTGRRLGHRAVGPLAAGVHATPLVADDFRGATGNDLILRLAAVSSYPDGASDVAQASFQVDGSQTAALPSRAMLLGNTPNPGSFTRISFLLPAQTEDVSLRMFDAQGRRIRTFDRGFSPGLNEVLWDGTDDTGHAVSPGVYFYRLNVGPLKLSRRTVIVRQ